MLAYCRAYQITKNRLYCEIAEKTAEYVMREMTAKEGGFYLYGTENEQLILRPKETYDGAMTSGNSVMAYNLVQLYLLTGEEKFEGQPSGNLTF